MADEKKGFLLRLSPRMFEEVRRWAEQDLRSINGQIEWLLQQALNQRSGTDASEKTAAKKRRPAAD